MPQLDAAARALASEAPIEVTAASHLLSELSLSMKPFHPAGLIEAFKICGRTPPFRIDSIRDTDVIVFSAVTEHITAAEQTARRQARASGATTIDEVGEELAANGIELAAPEVRRYLEALPDVDFLDENWLWFPTVSGNRAATLVEKMLSVHHPQSISSLRGGIRRENRFRKTRGRSGWPLIVPPSDVLAELLRRHHAANADDANHSGQATSATWVPENMHFAMYCDHRFLRPHPDRYQE